VRSGGEGLDGADAGGGAVDEGRSDSGLLTLSGEEGARDCLRGGLYDNEDGDGGKNDEGEGVGSGQGEDEAGYTCR
jgi:hypothetical protein